MRVEAGSHRDHTGKRDKGFRAIFSPTAFSLTRSEFHCKSFLSDSGDPHHKLRKILDTRYRNRCPREADTEAYHGPTHIVERGYAVKAKQEAEGGLRASR